MRLAACLCMPDRSLQNLHSSFILADPFWRPNRVLPGTAHGISASKMPMGLNSSQAQGSRGKGLLQSMLMPEELCWPVGSVAAKPQMCQGEIGNIRRRP